MTPSLKYAWIALKHKWYVFLGGLRTRANLWDLIKHDWTKFLPSELPHYGRQFYGSADDHEGFICCWTRHQNRHQHHWEYWIPRTGLTYPDNEPIPMPVRAVREMVADWLGAGKAYAGKWPDPDNWEWYENNKNRMRLHPKTRMKVEHVIGELQNKGGRNG